MRRNYFTAAEYNQANMAELTKDKHCDEWGRYITLELFRQFGHKLKKPIINLTENPNTTVQQGDIYYDIMATFDDYTVAAIECKFRFQNSYVTHFMETRKYWMFVRRYREGVINGGHLISCWADGKVYVSNAFGNNHTEETHYQNITTNANDATDGKKEDNDGMYYTPDKVFYYVYRYDYRTHKYYPVFSEEPIDIQKLEDKYNAGSSIALF